MANPVLPAFTQENLTSITEAIALGARQVQYGDKMITYTSLDQMLRVKRLIEDALCPPTLGPGLFGRRTTVGDFNSGK